MQAMVGRAMPALVAWALVGPQRAREAEDLRLGLKPVLADESVTHRIDAALIAAIIAVESAWDPWAVRFEPTLDPNYDVETNARATSISAATERELQRISWGLMQVIGGTARSMGFKGPLTALLDPVTNITWGTRYLAGLKALHPATTDLIAAFNAGTVRKTSSGTYVNQSYVDKVAAEMRRNGGKL